MINNIVFQNQDILNTNHGSGNNSQENIQTSGLIRTIKQPRY